MLFQSDEMEKLKVKQIEISKTGGGEISVKPVFKNGLHFNNK